MFTTLEKNPFFLSDCWVYNVNAFVVGRLHAFNNHERTLLQTPRHTHTHTHTHTHARTHARTHTHTLMWQAKLDSYKFTTDRQHCDCQKHTIGVLRCHKFLQNANGLHRCSPRADIALQVALHIHACRPLCKFLKEILTMNCHNSKLAIRAQFYCKLILWQGSRDRSTPDKFRGRSRTLKLHLTLSHWNL
jgi:hypothetical protein